MTHQIIENLFINKIFEKVPSFFLGMQKLRKLLHALLADLKVLIWYKLTN